MFIFAAAVLTLGALVYTLAVRRQDLPAPEPESPFKHLDERKATIYDNLRDLQFEYRLGKLSDQDYQQTKQDLQRELAGVLAEIDAVQQKVGQARGPAAESKRAGRAAAPLPQCPHCGAKFSKPMKFCGECGKAMAVGAR